MSSPKPPIPLQNPCSVIVEDTLYVYSPAGFLSLPLQQNATWSTLPNGVAVKGAQCVQGFDGGPGTDSALWVVGGTADESSPDYPGLQRYSFGSKSWATVEPVVKVTQNRRNHGAAFLNNTGQILVYAGSQDSPDTPSIETFLISTTEPYNVLSSSSHNTPVIAPVLLPWDGSSAIAVGGTQNNNVYRFVLDPETQKGSWHDYPTQLPSPLKSSDQEQAVLIQGSDNSKVLQTFDMSINPCRASTLVLQGADGRPAQIGQTVGGSNDSSKSKRDLSLAEWPAYNSTAAPDYTMNGFSLAHSSSGVVAMAGGNGDHPVSLFDDSNNAWIDTTQFFGPQHDVNSQSILQPSPSSSSAPSPPATSASTPTGLPGGPNGHKTSVILGAVLGSILGLIAILVAILLILYFRNRKKQQEAYAAAAEKERRMSFADRGDPFMMEGGDTREKAAHNSIAMLGSSNNNTQGRPTTSDSDRSTTRLIPRKAMPGRYEHHEMSPIGEQATDASSELEGNQTLPLGTPSSRGADSGYHTTHQRNSGWSKYFGNGAAAAGGAAAGAAFAGGRKAAGRTSADTYSNYTSDSAHDCNSHGPTEIPPLKLGEDFERERISRVVTGSSPTSPPTVGYCNRSSDGRTRTMDTKSSSSSIDDTLWAKPPTYDQMGWSPVTRNDWSNMNSLDAKARDTTTSSIYSHNPRVSDGQAKGLQTIAEDAGARPPFGRTSNATTIQSSHTSGGPLPNSIRASDPNTWPQPPVAARAKGLTVRTNSTKTINSAQSADSPPPVPQSFGQHLEPPDEFEEDDAPPTPTAITAIPVPASTAMQYTVRKPSPKPATNTDMSWLNLGPIQNRNG
ncbi:MAG: hypothetical protein Q9159_004337 [Coniocarpon cinnabarinum]